MVENSSSPNNNGRINNSGISDFVSSMLSTVKKSGYSGDEFSKVLTEGIFDLDMIKTWFRHPERSQGWKLRGGKLWSPYYIDLRPICSYNDSHLILTMVGTAFSNLIEENAPYVNKVLGVASAAVPLSTVVTVFGEGRYPSCWTRKLEDVSSVEDFVKKIETYGDHALVEGDINDGDRFGIIDDVITSAGSKILSKEQLKYQIGKLEEQLGRKLNVRCDDVFVIIDREQGGKKALEEMDMSLYSLVNLSQCLDWLKDKMTPIEYKVISEYHKDDRKYQDVDYRIKLEQIALEESPYFSRLR